MSARFRGSVSMSILLLGTRAALVESLRQKKENSLLWKFDVTVEKLEKIIPSNGTIQFGNSISWLVATDMNRIFFFEGWLNHDFSELSDKVFE